MATENENRRPEAQPRRESGFVARVLTAYSIGAVFLLFLAVLWYASSFVLLIFSSILVAVLLHDASSALHRRFRMSRGVALGLVLLLVLCVLTLAGWLIAPQVAAQFRQLSADLPAAFQRLRDYMQSHPSLQELVNSLPPPEQVFQNASSIAARAGTVFSGLLGVLGNAAIILFVAIYLAAQPGVYSNGIVKLAPQERRPRTRAVLDELGKTLRLWLRGKLLSMTVVGIATGLGLYLLGVPLALGLGILAGLLDFIPYIGPILAAIPALLMAFTQDPMLALYVVLLFAGLQVLEGYLLLPLIDRRMVSLPPGLTIAMQVLMGLTFGLTGVALATPLVAVAAVLIAMLYVEDVLKDDVKLPSDS